MQMDASSRQTGARWRNALRVAGFVLTDFTRNNCPSMAAGIAYWTLFSLFPLALAGISIMGVLYPTPEEQRPVVDGIVGLLPVSQEYAADAVAEVSEARGALGLLAVVGLLWSGTTVFSAVRKGINHAWHVGRPAYFLQERAIDLVMLLGVASLAFVNVAVTTNLLGVTSLIESAAATPFWLLLRLMFELGGLAVTVGAFLLLYRYVPHTDSKYVDIWPGALLGAALFQAVRGGFAWFISSFDTFNPVYGSLAALMAVLVWAYLSAMAIMLGAQFAYVYRGLYGTHAGELALPPPPTRPSAARPPGLRGLVLSYARWLLPPEKKERV